jgi:hypothetical protein
MFVHMFVRVRKPALAVVLAVTALSGRAAFRGRLRTAAVSGAVGSVAGARAGGST